MRIEVYSPTIRRKEMDAVLTAMVEDRIGPGEQTKLLIHAAKEKLNFDHCLALRSPAFALRLSLKALGLSAGDGVLVSALSPIYYAWVIKELECVPVFCDVLPSTACVGRETAEKALTQQSGGAAVKCAVIHHALGFVSGGGEIAELGIPVIEDCSRSFGTGASANTATGAEDASDRKRERAAGSDSSGGEDGAAEPSSGVFTILGLEERDMLTSGGGALLYSPTRRDAALLRNLGALPQEYGLPDMNAAMAAVQIRETEKNLQKRAEIAALYTQSALRTRHKMFPRQEDYNNYAFPLVLETGIKDVKSYARRNDIAVESAFENTLIGSGIVPPEQCPAAYSLSLRTVLFPLYPRLSMMNAGKVAKLILTLP